MNDSEVRAASDAFYAALNRMFEGDLGRMAEVWSHAPDVTNMGPFGGRQVGWEAALLITNPGAITAKSPANRLTTVAQRAPKNFFRSSVSLRRRSSCGPRRIDP
jgi:hypothetical protein